MLSWGQRMRTIDAKKGRKWWYIAGSALVIELLILLAHGPSMNTVSMDLRGWKLSNQRTERLEKEGRIHITKTVCVGPITYRSESYDSALTRAERGAAPRAMR
jgi:hypothetical protein